MYVTQQLNIVFIFHYQTQISRKFVVSSRNNTAIIYSLRAILLIFPRNGLLKINRSSQLFFILI